MRLHTYSRAVYDLLLPPYTYSQFASLLPIPVLPTAFP